MVTSSLVLWTSFFLFASIAAYPEQALESSQVDLDVLWNAVPKDELIDTSHILTGYFPKIILSSTSPDVTLDETSKRAVVIEQYKLRYSRLSINSTTNDKLWAITTAPDALRDTLVQAIDEATTHSRHDLTNCFVSSASNLSLIMKPVDQNQTRDPFNWQDFSSVASILLKAMDGDSGNATTSFVGVVLDPTGRSIVDVAVIPTFVRVAGNGTVMDGTSDILSPNTHLPRNDDQDQAHTIHKRARRLIEGTPYVLMIHRGVGTLQALALNMLAKYVLDMIAMDFFPDPAGYSAISTNHLNDGHSSLPGDAVFNFQVVGPNLSHDEMFAILHEIRSTISLYTWGGDATATFSALKGQVLTTAGIIVARWSFGRGPAFLNSCGRILVENPDGTTAWGCLVG
ncbi:MAG: hypothetical protein M1817_003428 [Caeruleum heppii]|nr:MAG: hypothetical protein M1817_003428 [Caeruleum heppii]